MKELCFKSILLCFCLLLGFNAFAYNTEIDGIYYNFSGDEATVTSGDWGYLYSGSIVIPESVTYKGNTYSVTSIGISVFYGCSGLTSIIIPNSVTSIGNYAFYGCSGLTSIIIPNSVTSIGDAAFASCSGLTSIVIESTNTVFDSRNDCNAIIETATNTLVAGCKNTTIPSSVTSIGDDAFDGCSGLTSIIIPNSVTSIGDDAFHGCSGLTSIIIPNSVTRIGNDAFYGCSGLTSIFIPNSVTSIGGHAFDGCSGLTSIIIPNSVTSIGYSAFFNCSGLTSIFIPNSVTSIGGFAFHGCSGLTSIIIPNSVTSIGDHAFYGCSGLTSIIIPNSVTRIEDSAFSRCSSLTSVTISESVTSIGKEIFQSCKLRNLLVKCVAPPSIGTDAFSEQTLYHTTLYVPVGCWDAYAYDNTWYKFHNIRETATTEEEVSAELAFMLMDAEKFTYSVYDPVNDQINTINSVGINEDNPNHSWQMIEAGGAHFLYNIGAKKYVKRNGTRLEMTDVPEPIDVENGENGIVLGAQTAQQWALVSNEHMNVAQSAIDEVTGISDLNATVSNSPIYNLAGQRLSKMQKGINIRNSKKVLVK